MTRFFHYLLFSIAIAAPVTAQNIDITGPIGSGKFGTSVKVLPNGNIVVTDPYFDDGSLADVGAVYMYKGSDQTMISVLKGSHNNDRIGSRVTILKNGNYVISSSNWNGSRGAVTLGNKATGVSGVIGSDNSLVGGNANDQIGSLEITALDNGNYITRSVQWNGFRGAVTWGNGLTGTNGVVSSDNSLIGTNASDWVGILDPIVLPNGNYLIRSYQWNNSRGAVTWCDGSTGLTGSVSNTNSLIGSAPNNNVGSGEIKILPNSNYLITTLNWNVGRGAVTWGSGSEGVKGEISSGNSLVGSHDYDAIGTTDIDILSSGNYLVRTRDWNSSRGAVTWGNGVTGIVGEVSETNSLVGGYANDQVGYMPITKLTNGNYVVRSINWNENRGSATWGSGTSGVSGAISSSNSLVGTNANDKVGIIGAFALSNGNYVVGNMYSNTTNGSVTWGEGTAGVKGTVSETNSLLVKHPNDNSVGVRITVLPSGNYLVSNDYWNQYRGAVTFGNGAGGTVGTIDINNSLVGTNQSDAVGRLDAVILANGNYLVNSPNWNNYRGAVTWGNGTSGITGLVSSSNSLVGSAQNDEIGKNGIKALPNGNYLVRSASWHGYRGAITWVNGSAAYSGEVKSDNSLVGSNVSDNIGQDDIAVLPNSNYLAPSTKWNNNTGALSWGSGTSGVSGPVSSANSLVGSNAGDYIGTSGISVLTNSFAVRSPYWNSNRGAVTWVSGSAGATGAIGSENSLIGGNVNDYVGQTAVTPLPNGNYVVTSANWGTKRGAITFGNGMTGTTGVLSDQNSLVGNFENDYVGQDGVTILPNSNFLVRSSQWNNSRGAVTWGSGVSGINGVLGSSNSLIGNYVNDKIGYFLFGPSGIFLLNNGNYIVYSTEWNSNRGAVSLGNSTSGIAGEISVCNSVMGNAIYSGSSIVFDYNYANNYLVVGRQNDRIVTLHSQTNSPISASLDESNVTINGSNQVDLISQQNCRIIASIVPTAPSPVNGKVNAKTWVEASVPPYESNPFVARHFEITPVTNAASASGIVKLYFTQDEFTAFNNHPGSSSNLPANASDATGKSNLRITKYGGVSSNGTGMPGSYSGGKTIIDPTDIDIVWNQTSSRWEVSFTTTGFSGFFVTTISSALPLTLLEFKGELIENSTELMWKTTDEINTHLFVIERSTTGKQFGSIGSMKASNISGEQYYRFTDSKATSLGSEKVYYRLKQIDLDGTYSYSRTIVISSKINDLITIYPNPSSDIIKVSFQGNHAYLSIDLIDEKGLVVKSAKAPVPNQSNSLDMDIRNLRSGVYTLRITGDLVNESRQFVKF